MNKPQQETFDIVLAHSRRQPFRSYDKVSSNCMYRMSAETHPDAEQLKKLGIVELSCFGGILIPPDKYEASFEAVKLCWYPGTSGVPAPTEPGQVIVDEGHDLRLVRELQRVHDIYNVERWEWALRQVAIQFGLEFKELPREQGLS